MISTEENLCQVCGDELNQAKIANVVYCTRCNTPHHKDCWDFIGKCSTYACGSEKYTSKARGLLKKDLGDCVIGVGNYPIDPADCAIGPDGSVIRVEDSSPHLKPAPTKPNIAKIYRFSSLKRLRVSTQWQKVFQAMAVIIALTGTSISVIEKSFNGIMVARVFFLGALIVILARMMTDWAWFIDPEKRELLCGWSFLGFVKLRRFCSFQNVKSVGMEWKTCLIKTETLFDTGKRRFYNAVLKMRRGTTFNVGEKSMDFDEIKSFAEDLARHMPVKFPDLRKKKIPNQKCYKRPPGTSLPLLWHYSAFFGKPSTFDGGLLMTLLILICILFAMNGTQYEQLTQKLLHLIPK